MQIHGFLLNSFGIDSASGRGAEEGCGGHLDADGRPVMIGAVAANRRRISAPWTGSNVSITFLGGQDYQIAKTNSDNGNAAAWFPELREGDMRFRIQPQQANAYLALGLTTATGVTLDTGPLAEHVYVRGDGGYTASTGYTSNAGPTYPYQAGHFF